MNMQPIETEADYDEALVEIAQYFGANEPAAATPGGRRFDALAALIEAYETAHWPIEPTPRGAP